MKKMTNLAIGCSVALMVSCSGDYDCKCTGNGTTDVVDSYENMKKSEAKESCKSQESLVKLVVPSASCEIEKK